MGKKKGKHVLMPPFNNAWPKLDKDTEDKISAALLQKLQEFPDMKLMRGKKTKDADKKAASKESLPRPKLSKEEEEKLKERLKQQVVIGFRQVNKELERNQLGLVLISGDTQPPELLRTLHKLTAARHCPAACFSSLDPWLTNALGVSTLVALGFKKIHSSDLRDFEEFMAMVAALVSPGSGTSTETQGSSQAGDGDGGNAGNASLSGGSAEGAGSVGETPSPAKEWELMDPAQEKELIGKLIELLMPYTEVFQKQRSAFTPDDTRIRKSINGCMTMDVGGLRDNANGGQLALLLVQEEKSTDRHPTIAFAVNAALEKGCPVLHMAALSAELSKIVRLKPLRAVGFKKIPLAAMGQIEVRFRQFAAAMTALYAPTHPPPSASQQPQPGSSVMAGWSQQSVTTQQQQTPSASAYEVSGLFVRKQDDQTASVSATTSAGFISLSSEPTVQYLGVKPVGNTASIPGSAFVDTVGSNVPKSNPVGMGKMGSPSETGSGAGFAGVMGLDAVDAASAAPQPFYPEPRNPQARGGLKRALDQSTERGEFVPFTFRPTNVQFSMANPDQKKYKLFKK